jgi:hypothetical protein
MSYKRVAQLRTPEIFATYLDEIGADIPFDADIEVGSDAPLAQSYTYKHKELSNRFCVLPMEGWDGTADGHPLFDTPQPLNSSIVWMNFPPARVSAYDIQPQAGM